MVWVVVLSTVVRINPCQQRPLIIPNIFSIVGSCAVDHADKVSQVICGRVLSIGSVDFLAYANALRAICVFGEYPASGVVFPDSLQVNELEKKERFVWLEQKQSSHNPLILPTNMEKRFTNYFFLLLI